jgi:hypothetical protein
MIQVEPTASTLPDGAIIADLIVGVDADTRVSISTRRVWSRAYGHAAQWVRIWQAGALEFTALRSARGWEFAP